uniref:NYN domain-containing protein n=1 Tax=Angiostrongylus cantonensis TaxID=6313 RepID=A0A0K0D5Y9_ANGCA
MEALKFVKALLNARVGNKSKMAMILRLRGRTEQFLVLDTQLAQNSRYFEDMLPELHQILEFSLHIRQIGDDVLRRMNLSNSTAMCSHIRRKDFVDLNVASDFNKSVYDIHEIAKQRGLLNVLLFGDDLDFMKLLGESLIRLDNSEKRRFNIVFSSMGIKAIPTLKLSGKTLPFSRKCGIQEILKKWISIWHRGCVALFSSPLLRQHLAGG